MKRFILKARGTATGRELRLSDDLARTTGELLREGRPGVVLNGPEREVDALASALRSTHADLQPATEAPAGAVHVFVERDDFSHLLDDEHAAVVAPTGKRQPLFLISIPKSGTHLLYELARALGYTDGVVCPDTPTPGTWYCIEYSNSHTRAADFLVDTTRRAPFGNKHHPFFRAPALFIYRDPRDILVSESNWFHKPENSPLAGYLSGLSREERLLRLVDDPWLLGSIRDRVGAFIPWLDFPNVIPLSFEELVGARGGGSERAQLDLIWALQLKLRAVGRPRDIADKVFNPRSPTFSEGRVGAWREQLTPRVKEKLDGLGTDYLEAYGYADDSAAVPSRAAEFRRRPLRLPAEDFAAVPIAVQMGYLRHDIVLYRERYHAIPHAFGPVDLARGVPLGVRAERTLEEARLAIVRNRLRFGLLWRPWARLLSKLRR